ncbi:Non-specific serine/threonine protein kinase [Sulfidibacter corallicola]|uniref:Tetratricopeptide repeat protein n=1 Tax=Sulfidibacter corallicola TaxID=2818388 RepID=A0A8A4TP13_SULCO|nr:serine/threonine-protein kinase [Sulfidibacter corallicola]QTD51706.1 tetratricopeptide repeat protein [Sulfidibacter corallicola]
MNQERWQKIEAIWIKARECEDAAQREAFLEQACKDDSDLRREVDSLLSAGARESEYLGPGLFTPEVGVGSVLGPYRIIRELGKGGMGVVLLAEQQRPVARKVALKVMSQFATGTEARQRFMVERNILARLTHPWIARLFDSGTTSRGAPYLVMEYVEGEAITTFCDRRRLDLNERVRLLIKVAKAIAGAHQRGVIHRDIKPSNILVHEEHEQFLPKVIDFGIALPMDRDTRLTDTGSAPGTPRYMSPEQAGLRDAQGRAMEPDVRTDIYNLGLLLYELLLGVYPIPETERMDALGLRAAVIEGRLERADLRWQRLPAQTRQELADSRHMSSLAIYRQLKQDLCWILLKALALQPDDRYQTAHELARELERYLEGFPVEAGPPSRLYHWRKSILRHRWWYAAGLTFVLTVCGFWITLFQQQRETRHQRDVAERQRNNTRLVLDFVIDMFQSGDPEQMGRETAMNLEEMLLRATKGLDAGRFEREPLIRAELLETVGSIYANLAMYDQSGDLYRRSYDLRRQHQGADHPQTLIALRGQIAARQYHLDAKEVIAEYQKLITQFADGPSDELAETLISYGNYLVFNGLPDQAKPILERAESLLSEENPEHLTLRADLAHIFCGIHFAELDFDRAEEKVRESLALYHQQSSPNPTAIAVVYSSLAVIKQLKGELDEAADLHHRARDLIRDFQGTKSSSYLQIGVNLGQLYMDQANFESAEHHYREVLSLLADMQAGATLVHGETWMFLGASLRAQGRLKEAEDACRRGLLILGQLMPANDPNLAWYSLNLANVMLAQDRFEEARPLLDDAIAALTRHHGADHHRTLQAVQVRLRCLIGLQRYQAAIDEGSRTLALVRNLPDNALNLEPLILGAIGRAQLLDGRLKEAEPMLLKALTHTEGSAELGGIFRKSMLLALEDLYRRRDQKGREAHYRDLRLSAESDPPTPE